ncbi:MAG: methyl-accepting chemotaxis protein [Deltaproteobacteria bacterium]|nr:methyl-accepting chemotaxis protein [Deltaproteobacteria bacterium]
MNGLFKSIRLKNIQSKISLILIFLTTVILAMFAIFNYYTTKLNLSNDLKLSAEMNAVQLSQSLATPLYNFDEEYVKEALKTELMDKAIYAILIRDTDSEEILYGVKRDKEWFPVETAEIITGNYIITSKEILKNGENLGIVKVYITTEFMTKALNEFIISITIAILIIDIVLFFALFISMRKIVIQPINRVVAGLYDIAEGEGDLTMRLDSNSDDEVGELVKIFNRFLGTLQNMIKDIVHSAQTLSNSASGLSQISDQMSSESDNMSLKTNTVAGSAKEMSSNMNSVAAAMEQAATK